MLVSDIAISRQSYCTEREIHTANVCLTLSDTIVRLVCNIKCTSESDPNQTLIAIVRDALRQMSRMPEYRSGRDQLRLCPNLSHRLAYYPEWGELNNGSAVHKAPFHPGLYVAAERTMAA